ncbi:Endonuclease III-like protein 1 [Sarcoptes scabiei]|uniref:Endonuclease III homolog n=1 Tax=Sarcoptes scabiei TaxID=52283 RepID=A0A132A5A5_SARSC|nr:Endonuclease III-like protein 1 [Sarcoptes scabiei]KPM06138.1 endonuclease III-like protein 1-like protein [Sarcoptes scabiei]
MKRARSQVDKIGKIARHSSNKKDDKSSLVDHRRLSNNDGDGDQGRRKKNQSSLKKSTSNPLHWEEIYQNIVQMRSETKAAIDTMGCEKCYETDIDEKQKRFQILVSLMLSSQTRDQITYATMNELRKKNLSVDLIDQMPLDELQNLIKSVGFFRRKAEYLKKTAKILKEDYDNDIPETLEEVMRLPGVGPKMAHLVMKTAWNKITGIAVDTHVHRICNRLQWTRTKTPEQTQIELEKWFPKKYWSDINHLLVGFGQSICLPQRPKCNSCLNKKICPSSQFEF